jgi:hypothetical protein
MTAEPSTASRSVRCRRLGDPFGPSVFGVTAVAVALPEVAVALHAGAAEVVWVLTASALGVTCVAKSQLVSASAHRPPPTAHPAGHAASECAAWSIGAVRTRRPVVN